MQDSQPIRDSRQDCPSSRFTQCCVFCMLPPGQEGVLAFTFGWLPSQTPSGEGLCFLTTALTPHPNRSPSSACRRPCQPPDWSGQDSDLRVRCLLDSLVEVSMRWLLAVNLHAATSHSSRQDKHSDHISRLGLPPRPPPPAPSGPSGHSPPSASPRSCRSGDF